MASTRILRCLKGENMRMIVITVSTLLGLLFLCVPVLSQALGEDRYNDKIKKYKYRYNDLTVIGEPVFYKVKSEDTLLDIARDHGLGYNEMAILYPQMDPWMPPADERLLVPSFWVLPTTKYRQLVINVPEMRLYFFQKGMSCVQTYPVALGDKDWQTPLGTFYINEKRPNPTWYIPESLRTEYGAKAMPHGPRNPMGKFAMKFSAGSFAIHGTHMPWGVGRLVSHGCVRCYPEHIRLLYPKVKLKTKLEIIYEPIKFGRKGDRIFVEVHPDVYGKISDFEKYGQNILKRYKMAIYVDPEKYRAAVRLQSGSPTNVTLGPGKAVQGIYPVASKRSQN
jgi:L,D-transpeptidase ErfK/SrfK